MNVASLDLCKELYELSGWDGVLLRYHESKYLDGNIGVNTVYEKLVSVNDNLVGCDECEGQYAEKSNPAYDLGYLLRKLPARYWEDKAKRWDALHLTKWDRLQNEGIVWTAEYWTPYNPPFRFEADTPEDAAAKLCIELFKQGILTKGDK